MMDDKELLVVLTICDLLGKQVSISTAKSALDRSRRLLAEWHEEQDKPQSRRGI
jgi:hypothetical protein